MCPCGHARVTYTAEGTPVWYTRPCLFQDMPMSHVTSDCLISLNRIDSYRYHTAVSLIRHARVTAFNRIYFFYRCMIWTVSTRRTPMSYRNTPVRLYPTPVSLARHPRVGGADYYSETKLQFWICARPCLTGDTPVPKNSLRNRKASFSFSQFSPIDQHMIFIT